ncbi:hypothetical protein SODALDRAFT_111502 [Sodiomyces alkalinus F11]|uniref:Uncharacterized protein n=1 Tax=Sodiomyces alkalinus (strain CBS 110278 / VKM F-3762 / F11) TaxID=1314773 RepID=A0A3N2Q2S7_SODAK|nr:hypothetical protein SODALDRAFT_111502 [Sodiomyces alkalinus F11]ROT41071.1 hypothetical protein SODALDRAFT_111502 [Sodiomyces alkalinus F11]
MGVIVVDKGIVGLALSSFMSLFLCSSLPFFPSSIHPAEFETLLSGSLLFFSFFFFFSSCLRPRGHGLFRSSPYLTIGTGFRAFFLVFAWVEGSRGRNQLPFKRHIPPWASLLVRFVGFEYVGSALSVNTILTVSTEYRRRLCAFHLFSSSFARTLYNRGMYMFRNDHRLHSDLFLFEYPCSVQLVSRSRWLRPDVRPRTRKGWDILVSRAYAIELYTRASGIS